MINDITEPSVLDKALVNFIYKIVVDGRIAWSKRRTLARLEQQKLEVKQEITDHLLNLIEQSKEKDLPLHWLTKEIKKL